MAQNDSNFYQAGGYPLAYYGPVTQPTLENQPFATKDMLDKKQDTLVSGENIKSLNEESLLGEGNLEIEGGGITPITYSELKNLRDNNQLTPGTWYRITDYQCTTVQENTQSAGHQFDIIVRADDESHLNENAYAAHHEDDTYFTNCKLETWELKYSLDNDNNRFAWADTENGRGVIYYMKDEWNNECPYDFKNIQFKFTDAISQSGIVANKYYFTFSVAAGSNDTTITDPSLNGVYCYGNKIGQYINSNKLTLSFNVFRNNSSYSCHSNTFGNNCHYNTFGDECGNNTFRNECHNSTFRNNCSSNTFGNYIRQLTVYEGVQYCSVTGGSGNSAYIQNTQILNGTHGEEGSGSGSGSGSLLEITFSPGCEYIQYAGLNKQGELKIWTPSELS